MAPRTESQRWAALLHAIMRAEGAMPEYDKRFAVTPVQKQDIVRLADNNDSEKLLPLEPRWNSFVSDFQAVVQDDPGLSQLNVARIKGQTDEALADAVAKENSELYYLDGVHALHSPALRLAYARAGAKATAPLLFGGEGRSALIPKEVGEPANTQRLGTANPLDPPTVFYHVVIRKGEHERAHRVQAIYVFVLQRAVHYKNWAGKGGSSSTRTIFYDADAASPSASSPWGDETEKAKKFGTIVDSNSIALLYEAYRLQADKAFATRVPSTRALIVAGGDAGLQSQFKEMAALPIDIFDAADIQWMVTAMQAHFATSVSTHPVKVAVASMAARYVFPKMPALTLLIDKDKVKGSVAYSAEDLIQNNRYATIQLLDADYDNVQASDKEKYRALRKLGLNKHALYSGEIIQALVKTVYSDPRLINANVEPMILHFGKLLDAAAEAAISSPLAWTPEANPLRVYVTSTVLNADASKRANLAWPLYLSLKRMRPAGVGLLVWAAMDADPFFATPDQLQASTTDFYETFTGNKLPGTIGEFVPRVEDMIDGAMAWLLDAIGETQCPADFLDDAAAPAIDFDYVTTQYIQLSDNEPLVPPQGSSDIFSLSAITKKLVTQSHTAHVLEDLVLFSALDHILSARPSDLKAAVLQCAKAAPTPELLEEYLRTLHLGLWTHISEANLTFLACDAAKLPVPAGTRMEWSGSSLAPQALHRGLALPLFPHPRLDMPLYVYNKGPGVKESIVVSDIARKYHVQINEAALKDRESKRLPQFPPAPLFAPSAPPEDYVPTNLKGVTAMLMTRVRDRYRRHSPAVYTTAGLLASWGLYKRDPFLPSTPLLRYHPSSQRSYPIPNDVNTMVRSPISSTYSAADERFIRLMIFRLAVARYVSSVNGNKFLFDGRDALIRNALSQRNNFFPDVMSFFAHRQAEVVAVGDYPTWRSSDDASADIEKAILDIYRGVAPNNSIMPTSSAAGELQYDVTTFFGEQNSTSVTEIKSASVAERLRDRTTPLLRAQDGTRVLFLPGSDYKDRIKVDSLFHDNISSERLVALLWTGAMCFTLDVLMQYDLLAAIALATVEQVDVHVAKNLFTYVCVSAKLGIDVEKGLPFYNLANGLRAIAGPDAPLFDSAADEIVSFLPIDKRLFFTGTTTGINDAYKLIKEMLK